MAVLPTAPTDLAQLVYRWRESRQDDGFRKHLGASQIGMPCDRALWMAFRWCQRARFSGRMLRLFDRGQREEAIFIEELRGIGCEVFDGEDGHQFRVSFHGGHCGGSLDGVAVGIPEAPKAYHVLEIKTHSAKSFAKLKDGVEKAHPRHWAQMQVYMHGTGMERALYCAVNKDDDGLYFERIAHDWNRAEALVAKAGRIIFSKEPPPRISEDESWFECKFCSQLAACHQDQVPAVNCRTCLHSSPEPDGEARWTCAAWGVDIPDTTAQRAACERHAFVPGLLRLEAVDATESGVVYRGKNGDTFENGPAGIPSADLAKLDPAVIAFAGGLVQAALETFPMAEVDTERIWIVHPESSSHFVGVREDLTRDGCLFELGPAISGTEDEYRRLCVSEGVVA